MITIPLPIPVPTIMVTEDGYTINRESTELAKQMRERGELLTVEDDTILCCACKNQTQGYGSITGTFDPPPGFAIGGWFCAACLSQGELAASLRLVIDQILCEVRRKPAFDKLAILHGDE